MNYEARAVNEALRLANENSNLQYRMEALEQALMAARLYIIGEALPTKAKVLEMIDSLMVR